MQAHMQALEAQIQEEMASLKRPTACTPGSAMKASPPIAQPCKRSKGNEAEESDDSGDDAVLSRSLMQAFQASASPGPVQADPYEGFASPAKPCAQLPETSPVKPQSLNFESESTCTPSPALVADTLVVSSPSPCPSSVESVTRLCNYI